MGLDGELVIQINAEEKSVKKPGRLAKRRKIKIADVPLEFKRFAILPNVNGQKYTIGQFFTSREEQGEFILLPGLQEVDIVPIGKESTCQIFVKNGKYFLSPVPKGCPIFVNDVKISRTTELSFDSKLSLGNNEYTFLFRERELQLETVSSPSYDKKEYGTTLRNGKRTNRPISSNVDFPPGQNGLILSKILAYLPFNQVKSCRFVSQLWNEEGFKILRKKSTLILDFVRKSYKESAESMKMFRYSVEMKNRPLNNWEISLPGMDASHNDVTNRGRCLKLLNDLSWFLFKNKSHHITKLVLGGNIYDQEDYERNLKILAAAQQNLKELDLSGQWFFGAENTGLDYPFPDRIRFPKLEIFTLSMSMRWPYIWREDLRSMYAKPRPDRLGFTWLAGLVRAINRVKTIQLRNLEPILSSAFSMHIDY